MKQINLFQVDAFTATPFKGNPAAICVLDIPIDEQTMQNIAAENNLAETAFVIRNEDRFDLRWFTPTIEVKLCGHATLATAHILYEQGILAIGETARFNTKSGLLTAVKNGDWIEMSFPARENQPVKIPEEVLKSLQIRPVNAVYAFDRYLIELETPEEVMNIDPEFNVLKTHDMIVVTALAGDDSPYDFISRTFGPSFGVDEDPVTGSSHCGLVPYYAEKLNRKTFFAYQASKRGGELKLRLEDDRVMMAGQAVTIISGTLTLHAESPDKN